MADAHPDLDPTRLMLKAEENLKGYRQNLIEQTWETAVKAAESGLPADRDELVRLYSAIKAIDFALAQKPSAYRYNTPI
jgi:hypothetical protein